MKPLVLASASPRRRRMLRSLGVSFRCAAARYDEPAHAPGEAPARYVQKNAAAKAHSVAARFDNALIIGADTVVVLGDRVLGKPRTLPDALSCLRLLNGRTHAVFTGLALLDTADGTARCGYEKTLVTFRRLSDREIKAYLAMINPLDKAGAYAIQGPGALIVQGIHGCYYNVVGFPLSRLDELMLTRGISLFQYMNGKKTGDRIRSAKRRSSR